MSAVKQLEKIGAFDAKNEMGDLYEIVEFVETVRCFVDNQWIEAWGDHQYFCDDTPIERITMNKFRLQNNSGTQNLYRVSLVVENVEEDV